MNKILVVDDDPVSVDLLKEVLSNGATRIVTASSGENALECLEREEFQVVLSDIQMLKMDGLSLLKSLQETKRDVVVVLMTAFGSVETAIEAVRNGAFDYLSKPFQVDEVRKVVQKALGHFRQLERSSHSDHPHSAKKSLIGRSAEMVGVYKAIGRAVVTDSTVLISGESGTGKDLVAREIHSNSKRKNNPFIPVNCGALTESLLESELFGHVKGAFTGAISDQAGLFEAADGGTLFLDEIGEISKGLQVKLLRVLQEGEIRPVGSPLNKKVNVRIIAATNRLLEVLVTHGAFREDLLFRLKVIHLHLPPLRERLEDLPELVSHGISLLGKKTGKTISHVSPEAVELLKAYHWPGNIRELENALEQAMVMTKASVLYPEDFPKEILAISSSTSSEPRSTLEDLEKQHISVTLRKVRYNKSRAAHVLGIDRATLYRKIRRYRLDQSGDPEASFDDGARDR